MYNHKEYTQKEKEDLQKDCGPRILIRPVVGNARVSYITSNTVIYEGIVTSRPITLDPYLNEEIVVEAI